MFASLPKPRHGDSNRLLIPYTLTKRKPTPAPARKPTTVTKPPLPSHTKPAQPTTPTSATTNNKGIPKSLSSLINAYDDDDEDDDDNEDEGSFFSLDKKDSVKPTMTDKSSGSKTEVSKTEKSQNGRTTSSSRGVNPTGVDSSSKSVELSVYTTSEEESKILGDIDESTGQARTDTSSSDDATPLKFTSPMQDAPLSFKSSSAGSPVVNPNTPISYNPSGSYQQYGYYQQQQQQQSASGHTDYANYGGYAGQYNQPYSGETSEVVGQDAGSQQQSSQQQNEQGYLDDRGVSFFHCKIKHNPAFPNLG